MNKQIEDIVKKQFAIDYNCCPSDFNNCETIVTPMAKKQGARKFENDSILSILSYHGKLVITADEKLLPWCQEVLKKHMSAQWGFEAQTLISIDNKLGEFGYGIDQAHLFFLPERFMPENEDKVIWLYDEEIEALEEDERIDEAFLFEDYIDDVLGAAIMYEKNEILAVAGATANSDFSYCVTESVTRCGICAGFL